MVWAPKGRMKTRSSGAGGVVLRVRVATFYAAWKQMFGSLWVIRVPVDYDRGMGKTSASVDTRRCFSAGPAEAWVDAAAGGRLASLRVAGTELLVGAEATSSATAWGSYPMVPWAGRIRHGRFRFAGRDVAMPVDRPPHALHGTVLNRPWHWLDENRLGIDLGPDWPFAGRVVQTVELEPDRLTLRLEVESLGEAFPAVVGWHPWWRRRLDDGTAARLVLPGGRMLLRDAEGIPDGRWVEPPPPGPWDDCFFALDEPPVLEWPGFGRLTLSSDCAFWVLFDEREHAICVEPQSGPPDAFNLLPEDGLPVVSRTAAGDRLFAVVTPDEPLVKTTTWTWTLDSASESSPFSK